MYIHLIHKSSGYTHTLEAYKPPRRVLKWETRERVNRRGYRTQERTIPRNRNMEDTSEDEWDTSNLSIPLQSELATTDAHMFNTHSLHGS